MALIVKVAMFTILIALSVINNTSVLYIVKTNKEMQTVPNYFICSLAVADILYPLFNGIPIILMTFKRDIKFLDIFCQVFGPLSMIFSNSSVLILVAISFNRYVALAKPLKVREIFTAARVIYIIIFILLFGVLVGSIPFLSSANYYRGSEVCLNYNGNRMYLYSLTLIYLFIPLTLLIVIYYKIWRILKNRKSCKILKLADSSVPVGATAIISTSATTNETNSTNTSKGSSIESSQSSNTTTNKEGNIVSRQNINKKLDKTNTKKLKKKEKTTLMILLVVIAFFVTWMAVAVSGYLTMNNMFQLPEEVYDEMLVISFGITYLNGILNPIIYYFMSDNFNKAFKKMLSSIPCCRKNRIGVIPINVGN